VILNPWYRPFLVKNASFGTDSYEMGDPASIHPVSFGVRANPLAEEKRLRGSFVGFENCRLSRLERTIWKIVVLGAQPNPVHDVAACFKTR